MRDASHTGDTERPAFQEWLERNAPFINRIASAAEQDEQWFMAPTRIGKVP
jgi:hypothetical protein